MLALFRQELKPRLARQAEVGAYTRKSKSPLGPQNVSSANATGASAVFDAMALPIR